MTITVMESMECLKWLKNTNTYNARLVFITTEGQWSRRHQVPLTRDFQALHASLQAISTFSPVSSLSSNGLRMHVCVCLCTEWTDMWIYSNVVHTSSSFLPPPPTRPHTHSQTIWGQQTEGAESGYHKCAHERVSRGLRELPLKHHGSWT